MLLPSQAARDIEIEAREAANVAPLWRTILEVADEIDADLIVAGTRGLTAVAEQPLGSVSDGLVRHSWRPVLIVPSAG